MDFEVVVSWVQNLQFEVVFECWFIFYHILKNKIEKFKILNNFGHALPKEICESLICKEI